MLPIAKSDCFAKLLRQTAAKSVALHFIFKKMFLKGADNGASSIFPSWSDAA